MRVVADLVLLAIRPHEPRELGACRGLTPSPNRERPESGRVDGTVAQRLPRFAQLVRHHIERDARLTRGRADERERLVTAPADRLLRRLVRALADLLDLGAVVL